jgi:hypothetical protein
LSGNFVNSSFESKKKNMRVSELRVLQVKFRKKTSRKPREFTSEKRRVRRRNEGEEEKWLFLIS